MIGRFRARTQQDAGMTLVELLVAMFVTSILLAGVSTVFIGTLRGVRVTSIKTSTSADARIAMEAITRTLRVTVLAGGEPAAITLAKTGALSFYSSIDRSGTGTVPDLPTLIEYSWDGTCLNEAQTPGRALTVTTVGGPISAWDTGRTSKCLARTSVAPVFTYYTTGTTTTVIPIPGTGLAPTDRQTVQSVQVQVTVKDPANADIGGVSASNRITLVNVQNGSGG